MPLVLLSVSFNSGSWHWVVAFKVIIMWLFAFSWEGKAFCYWVYWVKVVLKDIAAFGLGFGLGGYCNNVIKYIAKYLELRN